MTTYNGIDLNKLCFDDYFSPDYRKVVVDFASKINIDPKNKNKSVEFKNGIIKINKGEKLYEKGIIESTGEPYLKIFTQDVNLNCYNITASGYYNMLHHYACLGIKKTTSNPANENFIILTNYSYKNKITKKIEKLKLAIMNLPKIDLFNKEYQLLESISSPDKDDIKNIEDNSLVLTEIGVGLINYNSNFIAENSYEINKLSFIPLVKTFDNYPEDINNKLNKFLFNNTQQTSVSYNGDKLNVYRPNTYTVETTEEMNNLTNIEDGDICVVTKGEAKRLINVGDNLKGKTIYFKSTESEICNDFSILEATNLDDNSSQFQILHMTNWRKYTWQILLKEGNNDNQVIEDNNSTLLINSYTVQGNYQVTSIMDTDDFYLNMYIKEDKQFTYRYKDGKWINIEIEQSDINGNIKKGENELIVYRANRINNTSHTIDDTNHTITVSLNSYDSPILLKAYKDSSGYTQLYTIIFTEDVVKNISPTYQFQCYYVNDMAVSGVLISEMVNQYNYLELPIKEGDRNISNLKINISSLSKGLYLTLSSYYSKKGYKNISCEEYFSIPKGIKRFNLSATYSSTKQGFIKVNYNENSLLQIGTNVQSSANNYKNILIHYSSNGTIFKQNNSSINSLSYGTHLLKSDLCILYSCNNTEELDTYFKSKLDSLGCSKYKTVTTLKSYLLISYNGHIFEYIDDTDNISENLSFIIDEDSKNIMLISANGGNDETELTDIYNSISKINNMTDSTTTLNTTINDIETNISDLDSSVNNNESKIQELENNRVECVVSCTLVDDWLGIDYTFKNKKLTDGSKCFVYTDTKSKYRFYAPYSGNYMINGRCTAGGIAGATGGVNYTTDEKGNKTFYRVIIYFGVGYLLYAQKREYEVGESIPFNMCNFYLNKGSYVDIYIESPDNLHLIPKNNHINIMYLGNTTE